MAANGNDDEHPRLVDVEKPITPSLLEGRHEDLRQRVTLHLTYAVLAVALTSILVAAALPDRVTALKELLPLIMPGLFGAYGTALGFYFSR